MKPKIFILLLLGWLASGAADAQGDFQKGLSYYKQGQYAKAIEEFEQIVEASPDYESGYRILGDSYLNIREYGKAISAFQRALRLKEDNWVSHYGLALAYYNAGKYRQAVAALNKGERYARTPQETYQMHHVRGSAYYNLSEFDRAITDLQRAVSMRRGDSTAALQLGIAYYHRKEPEQAERYLRQAVAAGSESAEAPEFLSRLQYLKATQALETKDYRQAARLFENYVIEMPRDGDAWFNLGLARLFLEDLEGAEEAFQQSSRLTPENWEAHDRLGFVYEKTKQYDKSLRSYQKAHQLNPQTRIQESIARVQERIRRQNAG